MVHMAASWSPQEVSNHLLAHCSREAALLFDKHKVSGDLLFELTNDDLKDMGIDALGDRKRVLKAIENIRTEKTSKWDIAVLGASPLVRQTPLGMVGVAPIDLDKEESLLRGAIQNYRAAFEVLTLESLSVILRFKATVLILTAHTTTAGQLLLETPSGEAFEFDPETGLHDVATQTEATKAGLCVLSSCFSRRMAGAFLKHFPFVICVKRNATVLDKAARCFNAELVRSLLAGFSVNAAFHHATWTVKHTASLASNADESSKFILVTRDEADPETPLFPQSEMLPLLRLDDGGGMPHHNSIQCVGRQMETWQVVHSFSRAGQRQVMICGIGGVGKQTVANAAVEYLSRRKRYVSDRVFWVRLKDVCSICALQPLVADAFAPPLGERLVVLQQVESLLTFDSGRFLVFLADTLAQNPKLRIILTSRRAIRASTAVSLVHIRPLTVSLATKLLQFCAPRVPSALLENVATLCGCLPLVLKVVGHSLENHVDPAQATRDFIAKAPLSSAANTTAPSGDVSYITLFINALGPTLQQLPPDLLHAVWRLSIFKGAFDASAAQAVLGKYPNYLLHSLWEQKVIENAVTNFGPQAHHMTPFYYLHHGMQLVVQHVMPAELKANTDQEVRDNFVLHFVSLVGRLAKQGDSPATTAQYRQHAANIDLALDLAGTGWCLAALLQNGRSLFVVHMSAQRRSDLYERLLGVLLSARQTDQPLVSCTAVPSQRSVKIQEALSSFEKQNSGSLAVRSRMLMRRRSVPLHHCKTKPLAALELSRKRSSVSLSSLSDPTSPMNRTPTSAGTGNSKHVRFSFENTTQLPLHQGCNDASRIAEASSPKRDPSSNCIRHDVSSISPDEQQPVDEPDPGPLKKSMEEGRTAAAVSASTPSHDTGDHSFTEVKSKSACVLTTPALKKKPSRPLTLSYMYASGETITKEVMTVPAPATRMDFREPHTLADNARLQSRLAQLDPMEDPWYLDWRNDTVLCNVLLELASAQAGMGHFAHAAQLLRKALMTLDSAQQSCRCSIAKDTARAQLLLELSRVLLEQGLWTEAEAMLWQSKQLSKHLNLVKLEAAVTCELAEFNARYRGRMATAERLFRRGLDMRVRVLGLDNVDTAQALNALGVFLAKKGELSESKKCIMDSIVIREKLLGKTNLLVGEAYHNLAGIMDDMGDLDDAVRLYELALKIKQACLPENHHKIAETQNNLSVLYQKNHRYAECIAMLRNCMQQCTAMLGHDHPSTASVKANLGHAIHSYATHQQESEASSEALVQAQLDEAQCILYEALRAKESIFRNPIHPGIAICRASLGQVCFKMKNYGKAVKNFQFALNCVGSKNTSADAACYLFWLGKSLYYDGNHKEARRYLKQALAHTQSSTLTDARRAEAKTMIGTKEPENEPDVCDHSKNDWCSDDELLTASPRSRSLSERSDWSSDIPSLSGHSPTASDAASRTMNATLDGTQRSNLLSMSGIMKRIRETASAYDKGRSDVGEV